MSQNQKALKNVAFYRVAFQSLYTPMGCLNVIRITLFLIIKLELFLSIELTMLKDKELVNELERYTRC